MLVRVTIVRDAAGSVVNVRGTNQDVTERVAAQRQLQALLEQADRDARTKGELLREVNHRVTNNLAAILGLLVGEQKAISPADGPVVRPVLARLNQRIQGLLSAHRLLSESSWAPVRVDKLAEKVFGAALSADPDRGGVRVTIVPSAVMISPRQAGSLALVLNELATNSIKHGRAADRPLAISFESASEGEFVTMCYRDDGPGFPEEVIAGTRGSIGQRLIRQLVGESLRGHVTLANDRGAVVKVGIRLEEVHRT
jgi:two-component sensor histidine kinase